MSLMKLLSTTNTLSEARDHPHRYKVQRGALPTFGNPTQPTVSRDFSAKAQQMRSETVDEAAPRAKTAKVTSWVEKVNPFKPSRPMAARVAIQGELSLDKVKPVRNDLNDSDLELVAATKKTEAAPSAVKIESIEVPVVIAQTIFERVRGLFPRAK